MIRLLIIRFGEKEDFIGLSIREHFSKLNTTFCPKSIFFTFGIQKKKVFL